MMENCTVSISELTGTTNKAYSVVKASISAMIMAARPDIQVLYDMPAGQGYQFVIHNVNAIKPESKIIILTDAGCGLAANTELIVVGIPQRNTAIGSITSGACIRSK